MGAKLAATWALRALSVFATIEITACAGSWYLERQGYFYVPERTDGFAVYQAQRDPDLGWSDPQDDEFQSVDGSGARRLPAFPDPLTPACVSLYGDSFVWGAEVSNEHAWANVLASRARCRVANWGVPGFGTDQAWLRFRRSQSDRPRIALLGILSENVMRNVNRYRALLASRTRFGLKPRFVLDPDGSLRLVPLPMPDEAGFRALAQRPEEHLADEHFLPGGPSGLRRRSFPYVVSLLGLFGDYRIRAALAGQRPYAAFYDAAHPSRALQITAATARAFHDEAERRGAFAGVILIPTGRDFAMRRAAGRWVYAPLAAELERAGIPYLDAGERLLDALAGRDSCAIYTHCTAGHLNEEGSRMLGEAVHSWLERLGKLGG